MIFSPNRPFSMSFLYRSYSLLERKVTCRSMLLFEHSILALYSLLNIKLNSKNLAKTLIWLGPCCLAYDFIFSVIFLNRCPRKRSSVSSLFARIKFTTDLYRWSISDSDVVLWTKSTIVFNSSIDASSIASSILSFLGSLGLITIISFEVRSIEKNIYNI